MLPFLSTVDQLCTKVGEHRATFGLHVRDIPPCVGPSDVMGMNILNHLASKNMTIGRLLEILRVCASGGYALRNLSTSLEEITKMEKSGEWSVYNSSLRNQSIPEIDSLPTSERKFANRIIDLDMIPTIANYREIPIRLSGVVPFLIAYSILYDLEISGEIEQFVSQHSNFDNGLSILEYIARQKKMTLRDLFVLLKKTTFMAKSELLKMVKEQCIAVRLDDNSNPSTVPSGNNNNNNNFNPFASGSQKRRNPVSNCISQLQQWVSRKYFPKTLELYEMDGLADLLGKYYSLLVSLEHPLFTTINNHDPNIEIKSENEKKASIILIMMDLPNFEISQLISALSLIAEEDFAEIKEEQVRRPPSKKTAQTQKIETPPVKDDWGQCCVCMDEIRNVLFNPCRHMCCCEKCSRNMNTCPTCRAEITEKIIVFFP